MAPAHDSDELSKQDDPQRATNIHWDSNWCAMERQMLDGGHLFRHVSPTHGNFFQWTAEFNSALVLEPLNFVWTWVNQNLSWLEKGRRWKSVFDFCFDDICPSFAFSANHRVLQFLCAISYAQLAIFVKIFPVPTYGHCRGIRASGSLAFFSSLFSINFGRCVWQWRYFSKLSKFCFRHTVILR